MVSVASWISVSAVAVSVTALIVVIAIMSGFRNSLETRIISADAPLQVDSLKGFDTDFQAHPPFKSIPGIQTAAPFVWGEAVFPIHKSVQGVTVIGITPAYLEATSLHQFRTAGTLAMPANGLLIGKELADQFGIRPGDILHLTSPWRGRSLEGKVTGVLYVGVYAYDLNMVYVPLERAQHLFGTGSRVTGYKLSLASPAELDTVKIQVQNKVGPLVQVTTWKDRNQYLVGAIQLERKIMILVISAMVLVACMTISATMMMMALSKGRSVGILRALGLSPSDIRHIFWMEGLFLGGVGTAIGCGLGTMIARYVNPIMDGVEWLIGSDVLPETLYYWKTIPVSLTAGDYAVTVLYCLTLSILATLYPANYAGKADPIEVIRNV